MTEPAKTVPRRRWTRRLVVGLGALAIVVAAGLYLTSEGFQNTVRKKLVVELERVTGARVEIRHFRWNVSRLEVEADDVTLHGLEPAGEVPYAHVDRLYARAKILSFFGREIGLRDVTFDHPVIHIMVFPDGSTNQPVPKVKTESNESPIDRLFDLAVDRTEINNGLLIFNDHRLPFDFSGQDVSAHMTYATLARRFDGSIRVGQIDTRYKQFLPVRSSVDLEYSLGHDAAELKSFHWASARSKVDASGRMRDYNDPQIDLTYNVALDLGETGDVARVPQLRTGKLLASGQGTYNTAEFSTAGRITLQNAVWVEDGRTVPGLNATTAFSATRERLSFSGMQGSVYGGRISGDADIQHWFPALERTGAHTRPTAGDPQKGSATLKLDGLRVADVFGALSTAGFPLARVHAAGFADGAVYMKWTGSPHSADTNFAIDVNPPANPASYEVPLNGRIRATYRGGSDRLEVEEISLATRATRINATGALGSETAQLKLAINSNDLAEPQPAVSAWWRLGTLPVAVHGRASFTGRLYGRVKQPNVSGHFDLADFDTLVRFPQRTAPGQTVVPASTSPVHWDSLTADVEYSPSLLAVQHGVLKRGTAQIAVDGSTQLRKGVFDEHTPFQVALRVQRADISDLQSLAGLGYPITGTLTGELNVRGTEDAMDGGGSLQVAGGSLYGEPFPSMKANIRVSGREAQLSDITLAHNGGRITGNAAYDLASDGFRFDLHGAGFDLANIKRFQSARLTVQGIAEFTAHGSGTTEAPQINGTLSLKKLVLNGEPAGDLEATATTRGADMELSAHSRIESGELTVGGKVHLRDDFPVDLKLHFANFDVDPVLRAYLQNRVTGHSQMAGDVTLSGPLREPRLLHVAGTVTQFTAEIEKLPIASEGPIAFEFADETLHIERFHLLGPRTDLMGGGMVAFGGDKEMNLHAAGRVDLQMVQTLNPDLRGSGESTLTLAVSGTLQHPRMEGQVEIKNAGLSIVDLPNGLSDINGLLIFNENRLQVQHLSAHSGGGELALGGFISYASGIYFNLSATSGDIRFRYPEGVSSVANANLRFVGTTASSLLSGDVTITRFGLNPRFDFAYYLARTKQPAAIPQVNSPLNNLRFDVHVVSTPELQVETALGKFSGNVDLHLRGTAAVPALLGRVNVIQGDVSFAGTKYHLERGDITLTNPVHIEPVLNIEASARVRDYDITMGLHGTLDRLSITYRSDPPLPTGDIIALIALGRTKEDTGIQSATQSAFSETTSNAILSQALNAGVSNRSQKLFGFSRIKIDPEAGGPESNPNTRVTIEQQVSDKVTLTFITNLTQSGQEIVQVEYNINKNVSLVGVRDQNGVLGFDVRLRQRRR